MTLREFVQDAYIYTVGFSDTGEPEAFVAKKDPAACPHCQSVHFLFIIHANQWACLFCSGRVN